MEVTLSTRRSQWPRGLRRRSAAARLLRSWVRIPPGAWIFVCCECCALSGRGLCDELITRPEESYRLWCVVVCDLKTSRMRRPWPALGRSATAQKNIKYTCDLCNLDLPPNENRVELQRAKCSKKHHSFLFSGHVFSWRTWQYSRIKPEDRNMTIKI